MDVAVVIAAYNAGSYLEQALHSVLAQSHPPAEIVVVDDGSSKPLEVADPKVRVVRQDNAGPGPARDRGVAESRSPLIAFLDADDLWLKDKLAAQVAVFATRPALGLCSTDFDIVDGEGVYRRPGYGGHDGTYADLLRGCGIALSTVVVSREAFEEVGGFRPLAIAQDWDLWLRISRQHEIHHIPETLARYRIHSANLSGDYAQTYRDARVLLADHAHPAARTGRRRARRLAGVQAFDDARAAGRQHDWRRLARALWYAGRHAPGFTLRGLALSVWTRVRPSWRPQRRIR